MKWIRSNKVTILAALAVAAIAVGVGGYDVRAGAIAGGVVTLVLVERAIRLGLRRNVEG